jgi:hypothetical protein
MKTIRRHIPITVFWFLLAACLLFFGWIAGLYTAQYCYHH